MIDRKMSYQKALEPPIKIQERVTARFIGFLILSAMIARPITLRSCVLTLRNPSIVFFLSRTDLTLSVRMRFNLLRKIHEGDFQLLTLERVYYCRASGANIALHPL